MQLQGLPAGNRTRVLWILDQCSTTELQKPLPSSVYMLMRWSLPFIMYIFMTLKFSTHNLDFHLLTTSVNANIIIMHTDRLCLRYCSLTTNILLSKVSGCLTYSTGMLSDHLVYWINLFHFRSTNLQASVFSILWNQFHIFRGASKMIFSLRVHVTVESSHNNGETSVLFVSAYNMV